MMKIGPSPNTPEPAKKALPDAPINANPLEESHQTPWAQRKQRDAVRATSFSDAPGTPCLPLQISLLRQIALVETRRGNFNRAIALLDRLIASHPNDANNYNNRGVVYWRAGQLTAAIVDFDTAICLDPRLHNAYNNRANLYAARGDWQASIADYQEALDLNPFNVRARINLGITYRDLQDYSAAIAYLDEALNFGKLTGQIYAERGRTYHLRGDWNYAIADYRKALTLLKTAGARQVDMPKVLLQRVQTWLGQLTPSQTA